MNFTQSSTLLIRGLSFSLLALLIVSMATRAAGAAVTDKRLAAADLEPNNWLSHGRNYAEDRQSPLTQITPENISRLGLAWQHDTQTRRGLEASPLVIDGILYTTLSWSRVSAHDAATGEVLWQFDPQVPRAWGINACCDVVNRGVAAWGGSIYVGTIDGRLIALDAKSGDVEWETLTIDPNKPYTITGAPRAVNGNIIIGNGGAEYGVRGYVSAYDAQTGEQAWRFHTVPGDPNKPYESEVMRRAASTWTGDLYWKVGGGGTVWDSMAFDPTLNLLYIGVGNGSPWNRWIRSPQGGDNLFLSSIVALDATTGEYRWHYQTTPSDTWDYTATQHMILTTLSINGEDRQVLMQAPKNGFFYVIDRITGELLSADKYVPVSWASQVNLETGRPLETPNADHSAQTQNTSPAALGGHNWHPMAFNTATGLVYIPAIQAVQPYSTDSNFNYRGDSSWNLGQAEPLGKSGDVAGLPAALMEGVVSRLMRGKLIAWDPVTRKEAWHVDHPVPWNGGVLSTKSGLVFQGTGAGRFVAYDGATGETLWEAPTGTGIVAPPVSYMVDGVQYIALMAGWGGVGGLSLPQFVPANGTSRLLVYKLDGNAAHPSAPVAVQMAEPPPAKRGNADSIARGSDLYIEHCARCHGLNVGVPGAIPDLRYMRAATHEIFDSIVLDGVLSGVGMVSFKHLLNKEDADDLHHYLIDEAHRVWDAQNNQGWWQDSKNWLLRKTGEAMGYFMSD